MNKYELEVDDLNIHNTLLEDKLNNKEYLSSIIRLIKNINDNEVICIDGEWGVGKTFLIKQFEYLINNYKKYNEIGQFKDFDEVKDDLTNIIDNNLVFYYNAWENDDHDNPFDSIIYNILNAYPKFKDKVTSRFNSEEFLKEVLQLLTKIVSNKLFNIDFNSENIDKIKTFEDLSKEINTKEEKKLLFKELINKILNDKRMILIIDELDRCNPFYATKMLETIKHFYNLKNVTVIIVTNNNELKNIISQQFGAKFNSYSYLNKFYDYIITVDSSRSLDYCKKFLNFSNDTYLPHDVFYAMLNKYKITLRECNKYRTLYDTAKDYIEREKNNYMFLDKKEVTIIYSIILPIIFAFKIKDSSAYNDCLNKGTTALKEVLIDVKKYLDVTGKKGWLYEFINIPKDMEEIPDEYLFNKIIEAYLKIFTTYGIDKTFMKIIKVSL